jgi:hypothetical protein
MRGPRYRLFLAGRNGSLVKKLALKSGCFALLAFIISYLDYLCRVKKFLLSILTFLYMMVSSGIALEIHYCMGQKAGVDFYHSKDDKCSKCGMKEKKGGCCNDEHKFYKLSDSHKNIHNELAFSAGELLISNDHGLYNWQLPVLNPHAFSHSHSPPDDTGPSLCIRNCVFRI